MEQNLAEVKQEIRTLLAVRASLAAVVDVFRALGAVKDCVLWQWDHLGAELDARREIEGGR